MKDSGPGQHSRKFIGKLFRSAEHVLAAFGLATAVYWSFFDVSVIVSESMSPTLQGTSRKNGDMVLTEKVSYFFRSPERWEVVAFAGSDGEQIMKRVVGLPGERVGVKDKRATIDGSVIPVPDRLDFLHYYAYGNLRDGKQAECGDGYYVLGDFTNDSNDSRYEGPVTLGSIRGRAWLRIWPPSRMGIVE